MNRDKFNQILSKGLQEMRLQNTPEILDRLWIYMNFLIQENNKYNLTAIDREEEIISKHFLDSLVFFTKYNLKDEIKIIDIGTGAGFPGLVMKIFRPDMKIFLLDSLSKRIRFLNFLIEKLQLEDVQAFHGRAEDLGDDKKYREKFDFVVSRAVAPINILSEYMLPFAAVGGKVIFFKGPDYQQEIDDGLKAIQVLGGKLTEVYKVDIPNVSGERFLLEVEKVKMSPNKYPRRPGIPKKRPL